MKYYWGIDPGLSGWLAIADSESEHVHLYPLCNFDATFWHIRDQQEICPPDKIVLEEIPPAFGKFRRGSKANHELPRSIGWIEMAVYSMELRWDSLVPRRWQALAGCTGGGKDRNYERALELFPDSGITKAQADAVLLAWVARKIAEEENGRPDSE